MALERRMARDMFNENAIVELRQVCMTPSGLFEPGKYLVGQLPDAAFEMGLVEALPPVRGKSEEIAPPQDVSSEDAEK
ncbi:MAG: hypothetical protein HC800_10965 [Phormidesmis sp. RL_2_1]|nr:hypothetical protein [Phormidesmis sp. RL_2_1]